MSKRKYKSVITSSTMFTIYVYSLVKFKSNMPTENENFGKWQTWHFKINIFMCQCVSHMSHCYYLIKLNAAVF